MKLAIIRKVFLLVGEQVRGALGVPEPCLEVSDVVAERADALACDLLADEVANQQAEQRVGLERCERDRRPRVRLQRGGAFVSECVDGSRARLSRLLAGREVSELGQPLGLGVVLALARPREESAALCEAQQVVRARRPHGGRGRGSRRRTEWEEWS